MMAFFRWEEPALVAHSVELARKIQLLLRIRSDSKLTMQSGSMETGLNRNNQKVMQWKSNQSQSSGWAGLDLPF
jgi:hypothetical protein